MAMNPPRAPQVYQDYEPRTEWAHEPKWDTLVVHLPGFRTEKLKVQVTSDGKLRVSGEHHIGENRWLRFLMEFQIPSNCDPNRITAKYEGGALYVRHPKTIVPAETQEEGKPKTSPIPEPHQRPTIEAQQKKNSEEHNEQTDEKSSPPENGDKRHGKETTRENTERSEEKHEREDDKGITRMGSYEKVAGDLMREMKKTRNLVNLLFVALLALILSFFILQKRRTPLEIGSEDRVL